MMNTAYSARLPRKLLTFGLITLLLCGSLSNHVMAAPGDLYPFFGGGGKLFDSAVFAKDIALQPDNRIVVAGGFFNEATNNHDFALTRYNSNGSLDHSFGSAGKVTTDLFGASDEVMSVVIQPDGKIVSGGGLSTGLTTLISRSPGITRMAVWTPHSARAAKSPLTFPGTRTGALRSRFRLP